MSMDNWTNDGPFPGSLARAPTRRADTATMPGPMAVPKKRQSSARRDRRRSHDALPAPRLNECPQCHSPRLPHRVCPTCGTYRGREVVNLDEPTLDVPPENE